MSLTLEQFGIDRLDPQQRFELIGLIWDSIPDDEPVRSAGLASARIRTARRRGGRGPRRDGTVGGIARAAVEQAMSLPIVFRREASQDAEEARDYLESQRPFSG